MESKRIDVEYLRAWLIHKRTKKDMSMCLLEVMYAVAYYGMQRGRVEGDEGSWGSHPAHSQAVQQIAEGIYCSGFRTTV